MSTWTRLVRFKPLQGGSPLIGEPVNRDIDVGLAAYAGESVEVDVFSGTSVLSPGERTGKIETVGELLSLVTPNEAGTIRCIGLNYTKHAKELSMTLPDVPSVFLKPSLALSGPYPSPIVIPKAYVKDDAADYESEFALIIGKDCKNVSEDEAMDYLLGYTAANDVSSRLNQFAQSQWCFSKGFDGSCPIGPALLHKDAIKDIKEMEIKGSYNGDVVQESTMDDLIFSVPQIISFLSQGTTLPAGTVIITGTPAGVGWGTTPKRILRDGNEFRVYLSHGVGTLINRIVAEK